jgi:hypothetical protein
VLALQPIAEVVKASWRELALDLDHQAMLLGQEQREDVEVLEDSAHQALLQGQEQREELEVSVVLAH